MIRSIDKQTAKIEKELEFWTGMKDEVIPNFKERISDKDAIVRAKLDKIQRMIEKIEQVIRRLPLSIRVFIYRDYL